MNKKDLDVLMNCQCLQSIIKNDMDRHTFEDKKMINRCGLEDKFSHKQTVIDSHILQPTCLTSYREEKSDRGIAFKNKIEKMHSNIPFLYCPVCGTKTKQTIPEESFYCQFQKF